MRPRAQRNGMLVQPVGDQLVVFDQARQRLHVLSRTTAVVWRHCDGAHSEAELAALVGEELGAPVDESIVALALAQLDDARLLEHERASTSAGGGLSRREMLHRAAALAAGIMLPSITSCGLPSEPTLGVASSMGMIEGAITTTTSTTGTTPMFTTTTTPGPVVTTTTTTPAPPPTTTTTPAPNNTTTTTTSPPPTTTTSTTSTTSTTTTPAPKKVAMCHEGRTIMVDQSAVAAHLAHGDTLGRCR